MRKYAILCCAISLLLCRSACSTENSAKAALRDGEYSASSGMIDVLVTVKSGKIEEIEITGHRGGAGYEEKVRPLADEMIKKQSTDVDAITGATVSSNALRKAVRAALKKSSE